MNFYIKKTRFYGISFINQFCVIGIKDDFHRIITVNSNYALAKNTYKRCLNAGIDFYQDLFQATAYNRSWMEGGFDWNRFITSETPRNP